MKLGRYSARCSIVATRPQCERGLEWLEPDEGKLSCSVLRGGSGSNAALLTDRNTLARGHENHTKPLYRCCELVAV
jgi:hypothetical protein